MNIINTNIKQSAIKNIFNYEAKFCLGIVNLKQLPMNDIPQIAFWGRSNVGKSSLLNSIFNKKKLVRVSNTPGRTREINFFSLCEKIYFVDLPGYGYAKFDKNKKEKWTDLSVSFIDESINLKKIYLLIDSKVGLLKIDKEAIEFLDHIGKDYQIILTKIDRISDKLLNNTICEIKNFLFEKKILYNKISLLCSSKRKIGLDIIKEDILKLID